MLLLSACTGSEDEQFVDPEVCDNRADDDGDGLTDCADEDCREAEACAGEATEHCYDLVDNDRDGDIDCIDEECAVRVVCVAELESCSSGADEDGDGLVDCDDPDCAMTAVCIQNGEDCVNGRDEDGDGAVDCEDSDCENTSFCRARPEQCDTDIDEDGDGAVGCEDDDCARTSLCLSGGEVCQNGLDDDGDGRIDCRDTDCAYISVCLGTGEICSNGIDDDANGVADCQDDYCAGRARCQNPAELCDNRIDDDGDGLVDCQDPDCVASGACEACDNGIDDDGDGAADCTDPACFFTANCPCEGISSDFDADGTPECYDDDWDDDGVPNAEDACPRDDSASTAAECPQDPDGDGVPTDADNCPEVYNPDQAKTNGTEDGDACFDLDGDGVPNSEDNCPTEPNPSQTDRDDFLDDNNIVGDACDTIVRLSDASVGDAYRVWYGSAGYQLGAELASVGDVDGDGFDDVLVGAPNAGDDGEVSLILGPFEPGTGGRSIADADFTFVDQAGSLAPSDDARFGDTIVALGDVNRDGFGDFAFTAPGVAAGDGRIFVFYGAADFAQQHASQDVFGADVVINGTAGSQLGSRLYAPGDFDNDQIVDLVIGEALPGASWYFFSGGTIFGAASGSYTESDAAFMRPQLDFPEWSDPRFYLGDYDVDGVQDWMVASPGLNSGTGKIFLYDGNLTASQTLTQPFTELAEGSTPGEGFARGMVLFPDPEQQGLVNIAATSQAVDGSATLLGEVQFFEVTSAGGWSQTAAVPGTATVSLDGTVRVARDLREPGSVDFLVGSETSEKVAVTMIRGDEVVQDASTARRYQFELLDAGFSGGSRIANVIVGDWDGDTYPDLLLASPGARNPDGQVDSGVIWIWPNPWHEDLK
jgi:hypothetical protein